MAEVRIGIIGYGKIARDQHVPAIAGDPRFQLAAVVTQAGAADCPAPVFPDHRALLAAGGIDAVAICTPAGPRHAIARDSLSAGLDVLLEKPPATTLGELDDLAALAGQRGQVLFTAWHAQHNAAVRRLRRLLHEQGLHSMQIDWLESVDKWHPGQQWIWQPGGFGVFDAGINALSIASQVVPGHLLVHEASFTLQAERQQPIAATVTLTAAGTAGAVNATFDWRHADDERWELRGITAQGTPFLLSRGGQALTIDGRAEDLGDPETEYAAVYRCFGQKLEKRRSLVDRDPLRLLADIFLVARR